MRLSLVSIAASLFIVFFISFSGLILFYKGRELSSGDLNHWMTEFATIANGEMGKRISTFDWAASQMGPPEKWPASFKSTLKTILGSRYPMIVLWGDDLLQFYNDAYVKLIGSKHPEALGTSIKVTQSESWGAIGPMINEVMTTGVPNWVPVQLLPLQRFGYLEEAYFSLSYSAVHDDQGSIKGMLCVCSEISQQVVGERRLHLLRVLAERAGEIKPVQEICQDIMTALGGGSEDVPFGILSLADYKGALNLSASTGINNTDAKKILNTMDLTSIDELIDLDKTLSIHGGAFNSLVQKGLVLSIKSPATYQDLGKLVIGLSPNVAFDESYASFTKLLAGQVSMAIRNSLTFEEEKKRAQMLAEIDQAKTQFFNNVSHEFRTPLTLLLGPLQDILSRPDKERISVERDSLETIHRNAQRLLKLVNTLLDFSRVEAHKAKTNLAPVDISTLTKEIASQFDSAMNKVKLKFTIDVEDVKDTCYVDVDMWEKIILNLLSNAFKFTFEGSITLKLRKIGKDIHLFVEDTGTGIPKKDLPEIFKRFHRVEGAKSRSFEGSGIGLALVKELVELHSGSISVESTEGKGTTFEIRIPMGVAEAESLSGNGNSTKIDAEAYINEALLWSEDEKASTAKIKGEKRFTVLLVDDNADMRNYVAKILLPEYHVETATNGIHALKVLSQKSVDLILSDVMMPEMDGMEFLSKVRANEALKSLPFILLSARAGQESTISGIESGADDYLVKPFSSRELLARVSQNISLATLRKGLEDKQESLRARDEFLSIASHELNTPLTSLKLSLQMFLRLIQAEGVTAENSGKLEKQALVAIEQSHRLEKLVKELLEVSKVRSGKLSISKQKSNISFHIQEVIKRLDSQAEASRCTININLQEPLWAPIDPLNFERVIENLLTNAFKYAPGTTLSVSSFIEENKRAVIKVADNGPGIPPSDIDRIFERFERSREKREVHGLGLGLYITKKIVEGHDGSIEVKSILGEGSEFSVYLPL